MLADVHPDSVGDHLHFEEPVRMCCLADVGTAHRAPAHRSIEHLNLRELMQLR
ncbi:hypothetical protein [Brachybacterium sacelli]|uniref:hypothetical protein n=1 Tax=Brachybacterium sacelli TaxID=173364 RepID=UPI00360733CD